MEKQKQAQEIGRANSVPSYLFDANYSKFLANFQETFHPSIDCIPLLTRRGSLVSSLGSFGEESHANTQKSLRLFSEEMLTPTRRNSEIFYAGSQYGAHDVKSRAISCVRGSYGYPFPSTLCYLGRRDSNLLFSRTDCSFLTKSENKDLTPTEYRSIHKGETANTKSATGGGAISEEQDENFKLMSGPDERHEFKSDEPPEKKREEQSIVNSDTKSEVDERASYWERRRRNNASAKKSRDARRARELQTQIKVAFLEKENMRMLAELLAVRQENVCLRRVLSAKM